MKKAVRDLKRVRREVFVPLIHRPGEAQVDFGYALANVAGRLRKVAFFVMALPHSDALFVQAFERECTETFWEGHVRGFDVLRRGAAADHLRQQPRDGRQDRRPAPAAS